MMTAPEVYIFFGGLFAAVYCLGLWDEQRQRRKYRKSLPTNREIIRRMESRGLF